MRTITQRDRDELANYIDDNLSHEERTAFEQRLLNDAALREQYTSLTEAHQLLSNPLLLSPSRNFTAAVMQHLDNYPGSAPSYSIRNGIFLLVGVSLVGLLALYLAQAGIFDGPVTLSGLIDSSLAERVFNGSWKPVSFDGKVLVNAIVLLNICVAWMVLDRTILKPLFRRRVV